MRYTGFPFLTLIRSLIYRESGFPFSVSSIAFLSGLRISVSPISTASTRLSYNRLISALVLIPLSDTKTTSAGARFRSRMLLFHPECPKIPVIDSYDLRSGFQCPLYFPLIMCFHKRIQPQTFCQLPVLSQLYIIEDRTDQKYC